MPSIDESKAVKTISRGMAIVLRPKQDMLDTDWMLYKSRMQRQVRAKESVLEEGPELALDGK